MGGRHLRPVPPDLRLFLWGSALLAVSAIEHAVATHFQPAQWGGYQKNSIGAVMWVAVVVAQLNPPWARLRPSRDPGAESSASVVCWPHSRGSRPCPSSWPWWP